MIKYLFGLAVWFGMIICITLASSFFPDTSGGKILFLVVTALPTGVLTTLLYACDVRMRPAETATSRFESAFITQVRWTYADPARVGSHAETSLRQNLTEIQKVFKGTEMRPLRKKIISLISDEIARVARETPGKTAQLQFLRQVELTLQQTY